MIEICAGIVFIVLGLFPLVALDQWWEFRRWMNATRGLQSERTGVWECSEQVVGVLFLIVGILFILYALR